MPRPLASRIPALLPIAAAILCVCPVVADDGTPELETDRPDQTESSAVVPGGYVQLETGWTHAEQELDGLRSETDGFPETLLRIGLTRRVELRLGFDGYRWEDAEGTRADGAGDSSLGAKFALRGERGWRPRMALIAGISLPSGESGFSSGRADPDFRFALSHSISDRLSIGYNAGVAWTTEPDAGGERDTLSAFVWTAVLGVGATDRVGLFVELFGAAGLSAGGPPANSLDGGLTYLVSPALQLDVSLGAGLSDAADEWFAGFGLSYRFG